MSKIANLGLPVLAALSLTVAGAAFAQTSTSPTTPGTTPSTPPAASTPSTTTAPSKSTSPTSNSAAKQDGASLTLTDEQAKQWISKKVYSSDNKDLGEVASFTRDSSGKVSEMQADIGGFLGIGETRVRVMPAQFSVVGDRIVLNMTADQAKSLPKMAK